MDDDKKNHNAPPPPPAGLLPVPYTSADAHWRADNESRYNTPGGGRGSPGARPVDASAPPPPPKPAPQTKP